MNRRLTSTLTVVLVLTVAISACVRTGGDSDTSFSTPAAVEAKATTVISRDGSTIITAPAVHDRKLPHGNQSLVLAGSGTGPSTLDPALVRDVESAFLSRQIFRGLVRLDDDLEPQPELASRIVISSDGLTYVFDLQDGASFHDGLAITAQSVADSLNRATDPALADGDGSVLPSATYLHDIVGAEERLAGRASSLSGVQVLDTLTLEIRLVTPVANFLSKLAGTPASIVDVTSAVGEAWWSEPNGSGPFKVGEYDTGQFITLQRFDDFYRGPPLLKTVEVRFGGSASNALNLYESGDIDVSRVPFYAIDRVLTKSDYLHADLVVEPQFSTTFLALNPSIAPFNNVAIRRGLIEAVDRQKIVRVSYDSKVELAEGLIPPGIQNRDWAAELPVFDLASASRDLHEPAAGTENPRVFDPGSGVAVTIKKLLESETGIQIEVISQKWQEFSADLVDRTVPAFILTWVADYPDPENFIEALFYSSSPDNYAGYSNQAVDELLDRAKHETDFDQRTEFYLDAQQLVVNDFVLLPIFHDISYTLVKPYVRGLTITPIGIFNIESVWIQE